MKFAMGMPGLILYPPIMSPWEASVSGPEIVRIARKAEETGWDWLTISEHVVMPVEMADVMGRRFPESVVAAGVLAGATTRIRLLPYVLVLGYRHPVLLAKQIATVDFLSDGRMLVGAGIGHLRGEFEALGVPFEQRGKIADEAIQVMRELWTSDTPRFRGEFFQVDNVVFEPKPVQRPCPPIYIGGNSRAAMRRAARFGDGWLPWLITRDRIPECLDYIRSRPDFGAERRHDDFEVVLPLTIPNVEDYTHRELGPTRQPGNRQEILDEIGAMRDAGVTVTQVPLPRTSSVDQCLEWIEWFAAEIIPEFRD